MSATDPQIGDVWFLQETSASAIIVSELAGAAGYQLMSRNGRIINVTRSSLRLVWTFSEHYTTRQCSLGGCLLEACLTVQNLWYCGVHAPRNVSVQFLGDVPNAPQSVRPPVPSSTPETLRTANSINGAYAECPQCQVPRPSDTNYVIEEMTIHSCDHCNARWITLTARGVPEDGLNLGEDLQKAYGILEEEGAPLIQTHIGVDALNAIARSFREVGRHHPPQFAGITLNLRSALAAAGTILLVGLSEESQIIDGLCNRILGTVWRNKQADQHYYVAMVEEERGPSRSVMLVSTTDPHSTQEMGQDVLERDFERLTHSPPQDVSTGSPEEGDLWRRLDNEAVTGSVLGSGRTDGGLVYFRLASDGRTRRVLRSNFGQYFKVYGSEGDGIEVDAEYLDPSDGCWIVKKVARGGVTLQMQPKHPSDILNPKFLLVGFESFRKTYRPLIRRSAMDRLLGEDLV